MSLRCRWRLLILLLGPLRDGLIVSLLNISSVVSTFSYSVWLHVIGRWHVDSLQGYRHIESHCRCFSAPPHYILLAGQSFHHNGIFSFARFFHYSREYRHILYSRRHKMLIYGKGAPLDYHMQTRPSLARHDISMDGIPHFHDFRI